MSRPLPTTKESAAQDASDYWELHQAPMLRESGTPDDAIASMRARYIRDIVSQPHIWPDIAAALRPEEDLP